MILNITLEVEVGDDFKEAHIEADFTFGSPGRMYMSNGDPGYPPEPDEVEFLSVTVDGQPFELSADDCQRAYNMLAEEAANTVGDYDVEPLEAW